MADKKRVRQQCGSTMVEAMVALPLVLVACLLTLQMMLLYRAKISLNFATQEAARIGAMSNGRIVPRFLTDITRFSTVIRSKVKCSSFSGGFVEPSGEGKCPAGANLEPPDPNLRIDNIPGANAAADGNPPEGVRFEIGPASGSDSDDGGNAAYDRAPLPNAADADDAKAKKPNAARNFAFKLGQGMVRYGDSSVLQGFINGITPLYTTKTGILGAAEGQIRAYGDAMMHSCITYHNPTHAAFVDFGFMELDGPDKLVLQIPNDLMRYRVPGDVDPKGKHIGYYKSHGKYLSDEEPGLRGSISSMSVQDATLLSIEIKYSYPLQVPIAREILIGFARFFGGFSNTQSKLGKAFDSDSLDHGRWPMAGFATYRMQTPVHWHMFYPFGDVSNINTQDIEIFNAIRRLLNVVLEKVNDSFDPAEPQVGFCPGLLINTLGGNIGDRVTTDSWFGRSYDDPKK